MSSITQIKKEWFISSLLYDATSIKHSAFIAENEHRAVVSVNYSDTTEVKERLIGDVKKPYVELVLPNSAINGVYVGPSKEQSKLVDEISVFLEENKRTDIKIYQSKIPYVG